jgi:hypothetical protein
MLQYYYCPDDYESYTDCAGNENPGLHGEQLAWNPK